MYSKATPHIRLFTRLTAFLLLSAVLLFLSACSEPVPEDVDIATALTLLQGYAHGHPDLSEQRSRTGH